MTQKVRWCMQCICRGTSLRLTLWRAPVQGAVMLSSHHCVQGIPDVPRAHGPSCLSPAYKGPMPLSKKSLLGGVSRPWQQPPGGDEVPHLQKSAFSTIQPCCRWLPWWVVYRQFIWIRRSCSHLQLPSKQSWSSCTCTNYSWHLLSLLIKEICCYLENIWSEQTQKGHRRMLNRPPCQDLSRKVCPAQT